MTLRSKLAPLYNAVANRYPNRKALLSHVEGSKYHSLLKKVITDNPSLPIDLMIRAVDEGYPACSVCGKSVKHSRGTAWQETCSKKCWYVLRNDRRNTTVRSQAHEKLAAARVIHKERKTTIKLLGLSKTNVAMFSTKCTKCDRVDDVFPYYALQGYGCNCQVGQKIADAIRTPIDEVKDIFKQQGIKPVSKFVGMGVSMAVQCFSCKHIWTTWPQNIKSGHGCPKCAVQDNKRKCLEKYGVEHPTQRPEIRKKIERTMQKRYGVKHALQNKELFDKNLKSAYAHKSYRLGSRTVKIQGYEPFALDYLQKEKGISPKQIACGIGDKRVPSVPYTFLGKERVYHPDIFIPHLNRIVEVKSEYTASVNVAENKAKRKACIDAGYSFAFLVFDGEGNRL